MSEETDLEFLKKIRKTFEQYDESSPKDPTLFQCGIQMINDWTDEIEEKR